MRCGRCSRALVEIRMRVGEAEVIFRRCARCDSQGWQTAEGEIALARLLELARGA